MLQFTVPQFIDVEDKIIGPVTTRQFIIILTGFVIIGIAYKLFDFTLFLTVSIIIFLFSIIIAFVKVNGMPFHFFLLNFMETLRRPNLRVWNKVIEQIVKEKEEADYAREGALPAQPAKVYTTSRLTELALIVDTKGAYRGQAAEKTQYNFPNNLNQEQKNNEKLNKVT